MRMHSLLCIWVALVAMVTGATAASPQHHPTKPSGLREDSRADEHKMETLRGLIRGEMAPVSFDFDTLVYCLLSENPKMTDLAITTVIGSVLPPPFSFDLRDIEQLRSGTRVPRWFYLFWARAVEQETPVGDKLVEFKEFLKTNWDHLPRLPNDAWFQSMAAVLKLGLMWCQLWEEVRHVVGARGTAIANRRPLFGGPYTMHPEMAKLYYRQMALTRIDEINRVTESAGSVATDGAAAAVSAGAVGTWPNKGDTDAPRPTTTTTTTTTAPTTAPTTSGGSHRQPGLLATIGRMALTLIDRLSSRSSSDSRDASAEEQM